MEVIGIGVAITGIMVEDEGIIGNGKVIMLYYTLHATRATNYMHICEYIHLVISFIHHLLNIYECNYSNTTIFNIYNMMYTLNRTVY